MVREGLESVSGYGSMTRALLNPVVKLGLPYQAVNFNFWTKTKLNSVALVRKRTILTDRPLLVGEVSANLCGLRVLRGERNEFPRPLILVFLDRSRYFFIQVAPQLSSRG
jgi:hypothetical protein